MGHLERQALPAPVVGRGEGAADRVKKGIAKVLTFARSSETQPLLEILVRKTLRQNSCFCNDLCEGGQVWCCCLCSADKPAFMPISRCNREIYGEEFDEAAADVCALGAHNGR
jgi:hypothetical protein